jgi:hypothetical protein
MDKQEFLIAFLESKKIFDRFESPMLPRPKTNDPSDCKSILTEVYRFLEDLWDQLPDGETNSIVKQLLPELDQFSKEGKTLFGKTYNFFQEMRQLEKEQDNENSNSNWGKTYQERKEKIHREIDQMIEEGAIAANFDERYSTLLTSCKKLFPKYEKLIDDLAEKCLGTLTGRYFTFTRERIRDSQVRHILNLLEDEPEPFWDQKSGRLYFGAKRLTSYSTNATSQRTILDQFQEAGWPEEIPSPFHDKEIGGKTNTAITNLNKKDDGVIRFGSRGNYLYITSKW